MDFRLIQKLYMTKSKACFSGKLQICLSEITDLKLRSCLIQGKWLVQIFSMVVVWLHRQVMVKEDCSK